jgi:hypothetical protein
MVDKREELEEGFIPDKFSHAVLEGIGNQH